MVAYESRNQRDTSQMYDASVALDLTFLQMTCGTAGRNVKSATLAPCRMERHMTKAPKVLEIEQIGSPIRRHHSQRATLIGLGLNRIGRVANVPDTPETRGMLAKVKHLVRVVEGESR